MKNGVAALRGPNVTISFSPKLDCRAYCPSSVVPLPEARRRKVRCVPAVQVGPFVDAVEVGLEDVVEDLIVVLVELPVRDFVKTLVAALDFDELRVEDCEKDLVLEGVMVI